MDILAARKKAAERAKATKQAEPAEQPATQRVPAGEVVPAAVAGPAPSSPTPSPAGVSTPTSDGPADAPPPAPVDGSAAPDGREIELLSFRLGKEEYAILVDDVREVLKRRELTVVPNAPEYILGVASLRGSMLPVVDLTRRLGLQPGARDDKSRIIVVGVEEEDVGLIVDRVTGVIRITQDAIKAVPENIEQGAEYLSGIVRRDDRLFILLDLGKALGA